VLAQVQKLEYQDLKEDYTNTISSHGQLLFVVSILQIHLILVSSNQSPDVYSPSLDVVLILV